MTCHELENRTRLPLDKRERSEPSAQGAPPRKRWTIGPARAFSRKCWALGLACAFPQRHWAIGSARALPRERRTLAQPVYPRCYGLSSPFGRLTAHRQPRANGIGVGREPHAGSVHGGCRNQDARPGAGCSHTERAACHREEKAGRRARAPRDGPRGHGGSELRAS